MRRAQVSTGAVDDIRRASSLAWQTVSEFGLCPAVGPLSISALAAGGPDEGAPLFGRESGAALCPPLTACGLTPNNVHTPWHFALQWPLIGMVDACHSWRSESSRHA